MLALVLRAVWSAWFVTLYLALQSFNAFSDFGHIVILFLLNISVCLHCQNSILLTVTTILVNSKYCFVHNKSHNKIAILYQHYFQACYLSPSRMFYESPGQAPTLIFPDLPRLPLFCRLVT